MCVGVWGRGPRGPASRPHGCWQRLRHLELLRPLTGRLHTRRPGHTPQGGAARPGPALPPHWPDRVESGRAGAASPGCISCGGPRGACAAPFPPLPRCAGRLRVWQWRALTARWARHRDPGPRWSSGSLLSAAAPHRGQRGVLRRGVPFFPRQAWGGRQPCQEDGCWRQEGARPLPPHPYSGSPGVSPAPGGKAVGFTQR